MHESLSFRFHNIQSRDKNSALNHCKHLKAVPCTVNVKAISAQNVHDKQHTFFGDRLLLAPLYLILP